MRSNFIFIGSAVRAFAAAILMGFVCPVFAQSGVYAYPQAGQNEQQQSRDRFECHQWAVSQTGFDPTTAQPLPSQPTYSGGPPPQYPQRRASGPLNMGDGGFFEGSGMVGDAATGAALGAAGGAIAGDAGEGAAIGALAGTVFGALNRASSSPPRQDTQYDQVRAEEQARLDRLYIERREQTENYQRAYGACMTARDYTVQ